MIDVKKLSEHYPSYFRSWQNLTHEAKVYSFSDFNSYHAESSFSKSVTKGHNLKFLCFDFQHKHTYENVFGENAIESDKSIFGELNIILRDSCYRMEYSSDIRKLILDKFLTDNFVRDLHSLHPYEFFTKYGSFVASDYSSGGKALALFYGSINENSTSEDYSTDMNEEINNAFSWDDTNLLGGNLKLGRKNNGIMSTTGKFDEIKISVKSLGGHANGSFTSPQDINNASIDLSGWANSLSDKSLDVVAEFNQDGLIPIYDLIFDSSLKNSIEKYITDNKVEKANYVEPHFNIKRMGFDSANLIASTYLVTRFGKEIQIGFDLYGRDDQTAFDSFVEKLTTVFDMKVTYNSPGFYSRETIYPPLEQACILTSGEFEKLYHQGVIYFFKTNPINEFDKQVFSILNEQALINEYGLSGFLSRIPVSSKSFLDLIEGNYSVTAL